MSARGDWHDACDCIALPSLSLVATEPGMVRADFSPPGTAFITSAKASAVLDLYWRARLPIWKRLQRSLEKAAGHPAGRLAVAEIVLDRDRR